jgi:hypothetical protein
LHIFHLNLLYFIIYLNILAPLTSLNNIIINGLYQNTTNVRKLGYTLISDIFWVFNNKQSIITDLEYRITINESVIANYSMNGITITNHSSEINASLRVSLRLIPVWGFGEEYITFQLKFCGLGSSQKFSHS